MKEIIKLTSEAKSFRVKIGKLNRKMKVNRSGVANSIDGQEVFMTSIDVETVVDKAQITVLAKGYWDQIKKEGKVIGWEFKLVNGTACAPITLLIAEVDE